MGRGHLHTEGIRAGRKSRAHPCSIKIAFIDIIHFSSVLINFVNSFGDILGLNFKC